MTSEVTTDNIFKYFVDVYCFQSDERAEILTYCLLALMTACLVLTIRLLFLSIKKKQKMTNPDNTTPWDKTYCAPSKNQLVSTQLCLVILITQGPGLWIQDPATRDRGSRILDPGSWILDY